MFGWAMVDLAAISFLGLGSQPPTADWGFMIQENQQGLAMGYATPALAAATCILVVVVAVNVLGDRAFKRAAS
jgi:peptide/nickel transport system permease protein